MTKADTAVDKTCFTLTAGTSNATILNVAHTAGGTTVTVRTDRALANGETLAVKNTILNAGGIADTATAKTITIGLDSNGVYSITSVA